MLYTEPFEGVHHQKYSCRRKDCVYVLLLHSLHSRPLALWKVFALHVLEAAVFMSALSSSAHRTLTVSFKPLAAASARLSRHELPPSGTGCRPRGWAARRPLPAL
jgi:hypothetical protein